MTDPRLDRALEYAAEQVEDGCGCQDCTLYAGWAEAVSILADIADDPRDGFAKLDSYQRRKLGETIASFIRAMLGGDDAHAD